MIESNAGLTELVLATRNQDKVTEITTLLQGAGLRLLTLDEFPGLPDVIEDGKTLAENALKKAREVADFTGLPALADDTGLEVDYLNGGPGVYSSRFSGENATYADNVAKLLQEMKQVPAEERTARFRCVAALVDNSHERMVAGVCEGIILEETRGESGFGYDPVFYVPEYESTFAEMDMELKNRISHRAQAFLRMRTLLERITFKIKNGA